MLRRRAQILLVTMVISVGITASDAAFPQSDDPRTASEIATEFHVSPPDERRPPSAVYVFPASYNGDRGGGASPSPTDSGVAMASTQTCDPTSDNVDYKITNIIAVPSDVTGYDAAASEQQFRDVLGEINTSVDVGTGPWRDQDIEWFGGTLSPVICWATVDPASDGIITFDEIERNLLQLGYNDSEYRKWNVMLETGSGEADLYCSDPQGNLHDVTGCGTMVDDDTKGTTNGNNNGNLFAITEDAYGEWIMAQELFHTLGAIQDTAPHSNGAAHSLQVYDFMQRSYSFDPDHYDCADDPATVGTLDCGKEDYYSSLCAIDETTCPGDNGTTGTATYLATHYNISRDSLFVGPIVSTSDGQSCQGTAVTQNSDEHSENFDLTAGTDVLDGWDGYDEAFGRAGADRLCGNWGKDALYGNRDNDVIWGGRGDDELRGQKGDDVIRGHDGDDGLFDGTGNDDIDGGAGDGDVFYGCPDNQTDTIVNVESKQWDSSYC